MVHDALEGMGVVVLTGIHANKTRGNIRAVIRDALWMTVVGQCLGAGRKDEAIYYIKKLSWLSEAVIIASCLLVFALTKPITMLAGMEPASAKLCFFMISFITIVKPVSWVLSFIPPYGMRAAGDVKFSMITSCCTMWLCRVSLCIYLSVILHFIIANH